MSLASCGETINRCGRPYFFASATPLQKIECHSAWGEKQAQLELGIRYEEGNGVPRDLERAKKLYRMAARDSGGSVYGSNGSGGVTKLDTLPVQLGLAAAKERLRRLAK